MGRRIILKNFIIKNCKDKLMLLPKTNHEKKPNLSYMGIGGIFCKNITRIKQIILLNVYYL